MIKLILIAILSIFMSLKMSAIPNIDFENTMIKTIRLLIEISPGRYTNHNIQARVPKNHSKDIYFITRNFILDDNNLMSVKLFSNQNRKITIKSYSNFSHTFEIWSGCVHEGENKITLKLPDYLQSISFISIELDGSIIDVAKILIN